MREIDEIREKIKFLRLEKGYTQGYIAKQLEISQYAYHKLENGKTELKVKMLLKLALVLEVEVNYLLGFESK